MYTMLSILRKKDSVASVTWYERSVLKSSYSLKVVERLNKCQPRLTAEHCLDLSIRKTGRGVCIWSIADSWWPCQLLWCGCHSNTLSSSSQQTGGCLLLMM